MKKIIQIMFVLLILVSAAGASAYSNLSLGNSESIVAPFPKPSPYTQGSLQWKGATNGDREFLTKGHRHRIRQDGVVNAVEFYVGGKTGLTGFYVKIWRKNGSSYNLVGTSENLVSKMTAGSVNKITLDSPISGVQEGDYIGYHIKEDATAVYNFHAITEAGVDSRYIDSTVPNSYNWDNSPLNLINNVLQIGVYMKRPEVVFIGDSIIAGHPAHYNFLENPVAVNIPSTIQKQFRNITNHSYQNMGIGSQSTANILARFQRNVVDLNPKVVVLEGGVNDLALNISKATFLANYRAMLDLAQANNIKVIALKILPWTDGSNAKMTERDDWNNDLEALVNTYANAHILDLDSQVGVNRSAGTAGNLWNINPSYDADGVHFNQAGHTQIAQVIADFMTPKTELNNVNPEINNAAVNYTSKQFGDPINHNFNQTANSGIEYSVDSGTTWSDATELAHGSDGIVNLSATEAGVNHTFIWDAKTDLSDGVYNNVLIRFRANDGTTNELEWVLSSPFNVTVDSTVATPTNPIVNSVHSTQKKKKTSYIVYACGDIKAKNYDKFGRHKQSLCVYDTSSTTENPFNGKACSSDKMINNFLKYGDRDGKYSSYNKGVVNEVYILQKHINRLLSDEYGNQASGRVDGIFGFLTERGVRRLQLRLNQLLPNITPLVIDGIVGPFTKSALNRSC